jgi:ABC-type antimicrobial peptide transport system permease subunit
MTTARSVRRAKEIGIRKVAGAMRFSLIQQFICEAVLVALLASFLALALAEAVLPGFNLLTRKNIHIPLQDPFFWLGIAVLVLITGIISGSYPAFYLSSFKPVRVLKGSFRSSGTVVWFRKGLVVFQFMLSVMLIIATIVVGMQVSFIQHINLGYDRENLIYIPIEGELKSKYEVFKNEAMQIPGISGITRMASTPTQIDNGTGGISWEGMDPNTDIGFTYCFVGYDLKKVLNLEFKEGRDFSKQIASDSAGYLLNETAIKLTGYTHPIGKPFTFWGKKGSIIGVLKDFHINSLREPISPLVLTLGEDMPYGSVLVRARAGKTKEALAGLADIYKSLNPKFPFSYTFSDEDYQKLYTSEQVVEQLSNYFAALAIFISCLGLLGLVMFTAEQRTKEFGIRKVLGASPLRLFNLLSMEFLKPVCLAMIIASPLAWISMNKWLLDYAYRIEIPWWIFALAGAVTVVIALITVSFQSLSAATSNPVKSLRTE